MTTKALKSLLLGMLACVAVTGVLAQSKAAPYPHGRVTLVTHSSLGGGSDVMLRDLAKHLGPIMGVNFVVENVTCGSGTKAMAYVARGKPDGGVLYAATPIYIQSTLLSKPEFGYDTLEQMAILFDDA